MILKNVVLVGSEKYSFYTLRYIGNNRNECTYENDGEQVKITIPLCNKEENIPLKRIENRIFNDETICEYFERMNNPHVDGYILEDGQVILRIQDEIDEKSAFLIQDSAAEYRNKAWREAFLTCWERREILEDLELVARVLQSPYQELTVWKEGMLFTLDKTKERWHLYTPSEDYWGDTIQDVFDQASAKYPGIYTWVDQFKA